MRLNIWTNERFQIFLVTLDSNLTYRVELSFFADSLNLC